MAGEHGDVYCAKGCGQILHHRNMSCRPLVENVPWPEVCPRCAPMDWCMFSATLREQHSDSFYAMLSEFLDSYGLTVCAQGDDCDNGDGFSGCSAGGISQCYRQFNEPKQRAAAGDAPGYP